MTTATVRVSAAPPYVEYPTEFIKRVRRLTDDHQLCRALSKWDKDDVAERRFIIQLTKRDHHNNERWLMQVRKLYEEYQAIRKKQDPAYIPCANRNW